MHEHKIDKIVKTEAKDQLFHVHEYDLDTNFRHIYLMGVDRGYELDKNAEDLPEPGVDFLMTNRFIRNLNILMRSGPDPILIHLKTCGGDYTEGMAIYDAIKACPNYVTILNYTHARSMSSLIFQAANKRVMMPNSYFMFHLGTLGLGGTAKKVYTEVEFMKGADRTMLDIYAKSMSRQGEFKSKTQKFIKQWLRDEMNRKEDVYLTSSQAVKKGLADEVFNSNWANLTKYTKEQKER